ncbi:dTMP kinase [Treponema sp.]|uniref:dTMP kinase n=1 Tax=Treponema sp. TaxID=166 RepID=UPI003F08700B
MVLENFIVLEGIDGAGTTTQLNILKSKAAEFLFTAEPTSSPTGKFLRQILKGEIQLSNETAAYIFAADRNEHINGALKIEENTLVTGIREACANGKIVVSDRYLFSSLAYQSIGCAPEIPRALNQFFPLPKLLFFFDINPEDALKRISGREQKEIFEKIDFLEKTREEYKKVLSEYDGTEAGKGMKIIHIDAMLDREKISLQIEDEINRAYGGILNGKAKNI